MKKILWIVVCFILIVIGLIVFAALTFDADRFRPALVEQAQKLIQRAREVCNIHSIQYLLAGTELGRLKQ